MKATALILIAALAPAAVSAGNGKAHGPANGKAKIQRIAPPPAILAQGKAGHCPPGLAKKAVPCVPPGQVKNRYRVGERILRDYVWIDDPYRYGLPRGGDYIRAGDYVYGVDRETRKVLNLIGAVVDILN